MNFKLCSFVFINALCFTAFARPTTNTELGDVVDIHPDTPLTAITPTATLEEFAAAVKDAMRKAEVHTSPKVPLDNTVTENSDNTDVSTIEKGDKVGIEEPKYDSKHFNDIILNAVLDAVKKQVSNPDGSFDFMTIIKQLFDIWAKRFDHNQDGEVTIAEFAQWLIQYVKEKLDQHLN
uniref:EF-hand domain-containing protein n=1 Tax=Panagrolaimus sp. PS1159 TaxID=55785 RepID=A0AC35G734_9BILA